MMMFSVSATRVFIHEEYQEKERSGDKNGMFPTRKMREVLYATGAFEIGDYFYDAAGNERKVTDVLVCHYLRSGNFRVLYEVDGSGEYIELRLSGFGPPQQDALRQSGGMGKPAEKKRLSLVPLEKHP